MVGSVECQVSNSQLLIFFKARPRGRGSLADTQQVRRESSQRGTFWMNGRHSSAAWQSVNPAEKDYDRAVGVGQLRAYRCVWECVCAPERINYRVMILKAQSR